MARTITTWQGLWWRVWDMSDPHVAGGMAETVDRNNRAGLAIYKHRWAVHYWPPGYAVSVVRIKEFSNPHAANRFLRRLLRKGYVLKEG